jgi:hypothetical protein
MFEASWTGSASEDDLYVTDYGTCTDTVTKQDQIDGTFPSAVYIGITRDQQSFYLTRATPGDQGVAPPNGELHETYEGTHVSCGGYEETVLGSLNLVENWWQWPSFPDVLPLGRTDPTIPTTSQGEHVDRQEQTGIGGGLIVITTTWTWKLTIEPDAAQ